MRKRYNMNFDWDFHDGEIESPNFQSVHDMFDYPVFIKSANCGIAKVGYPFHNWEKVQLPHDLRHHRSDFDPNTIRNQGHLSSGIAWYRKEFFISKEEEGQAIILEFDGAFRDTQVFVNGSYVGRHLSGYTSFHYDVSDFILYGENNAIAVRCDGTKWEGWWYEAVGLYRDVHLTITNKVKIEENSLFLMSTPTEKGGGEIALSLTVENTSFQKADVGVSVAIFDPKGLLVKRVTEQVLVDKLESQEVKWDFTLPDVLLWDLENCHQYTATATVTENKVEMDEVTTKFGIRKTEFTPDKGFFLNGKQIKIKGVCVHDDFAGVGGAMSRAVIRHKIYLLKQWGCNGYRCSHNPPSPYLAQACDDFGLLLMPENRLLSTSQESIGQLTDLIRRDRNSPSVVLWCIGNEEMAVHGTPTGLKICHHLLEIAHKLDPSRLCTYANNSDWRAITSYHEEHGLQMDVLGLNYNCLRRFESYEVLHAKYPNRPMIGTENGSAISTRGQYFPRKEELADEIYHKPEVNNSLLWGNEKRIKNVSAYGETYTKWGSMPMEHLKASDPEFVSGYFLWTGFDYRGETFPFTYPSVITRFGLIDLCGFMKDLGHQYRVKWAEKPAIHLYPHWSYEEDIEDLEVVVVANTEEVELFADGISQGRRKNHSRELVPYVLKYRQETATELRAIGYDKGVEVISICHKKAGTPTTIQVEEVQKRDYIANGEDNVFLKISLLDSQGNPCPEADNLVKFQVAGSGTFLGCGNGDPLCLADDQTPERNLFHGLALGILRTKREKGKIYCTVSCEGLPDTTIQIPVTVSCDEPLVTPKDPKVLPWTRPKEYADYADEYL